MSKDDRIRLQHMLEAAEEARKHVERKSKIDLENERLLALSLVKLIEIIGEAASRVSPEGRQAHADIPWRDIVAMRNRLIHGYFDVDLERVWDTVTDDLPPLVSVLEKALATDATAGEVAPPD